MRTCSHEGCDKPVIARGMCNLHYKRWYSALGRPPKQPSVLERLPAHLPGTSTGIARAMGVSRPAVSVALQKMKAKGGCHIGRWERSNRGAISPVYVSGPGEDAVCALKAFTQKQLAARSKRNRKADGRWDERKAKDRMRWWIKKAETRKSTWFSALGAA